VIPSGTPETDLRELSPAGEWQGFGPEKRQSRDMQMGAGLVLTAAIKAALKAECGPGRN